MSFQTEDPTRSPWFSNKVYDVLKFLAQIVLPAIGAAYFGLSQIWGLPAGEEVVGTITIIDVFLGTLLGLSQSSYEGSNAKYDGAIVVDTSDPERDSYLLEMDGPLEDISKNTSITLKVKNPPVL